MSIRVWMPRLPLPLSDTEELVYNKHGNVATVRKLRYNDKITGNAEPARASSAVSFTQSKRQLKWISSTRN